MTDSASEHDDNESDPVFRRVAGAIHFYDNVAKVTMRKHFFWKTVQISAAALVPVAAFTGPASVSKYLAASLGAIVIISERIDALRHYGEHYAAWRFISEQLRAERYLYSVKAGPYAGRSEDDSRAAYIERTEALTGQERQQWATLQQKSLGQQD